MLENGQRERIEAELWMAQLDNWPDSKRLTLRMVLDWIEFSSTDAQLIARQRIVIMCLQHMHPVIFYTCGRNQQYRGCRYGTDASEYYSFSDF